LSDFREDAQLLLQLVGGKENVATVSHCLTRMRFVLKDPKLANKDEIEKIPAVKGSFVNAGQFQIIIGNEVPDFYNEFITIAGIDAASKDDAKAAAKANMNPVQRLVANLAEIFAPIIPALVVGGLILGMRNVLGGIAFFEGDQTITDVSQFWAGIYSFTWLLGEAIFHFLPVAICWSVTRKMGTTQVLGIVLGITLVSPQLFNAWGVAEFLAYGGILPYWDFGIFTINMVGYQAQVIPAMLAAFTLVYLERFFRKITPEYISMIVVPLLALLPAVILAHVVLGPVGWWIGSGISSVVYAGLTSAVGWLFAAVFGFLYAPIVITGLHHMTNAIDLQLMADFGGTNLWPMIALSNIAQGSAVLGVIIAHRRNKEEQQVSIPACISAYLGVTEPAMFGINLKYVYPFICAIIGSAIAAVVSVGFGVMANSIGVGGLPGILSIQTQFWPIFLVAMAIAVAVPIILTMIIAKRKKAV